MCFHNILIKPGKRALNQLAENIFSSLCRLSRYGKIFFRPVAFRNYLLIGCLVLLNGCLTRGYNLREGIKNFQIQNYRHAFIRLLPEAEKGQRDAQYAIGYMYYYGEGVVEDRKKAGYWISCAARAGQTDAIEAIGIIDKNR